MGAAAAHARAGLPLLRLGLQARLEAAHIVSLVLITTRGLSNCATRRLSLIGSRAQCCNSVVALRSLSGSRKIRGLRGWTDNQYNSPAALFYSFTKVTSKERKFNSSTLESALRN